MRHKDRFTIITSFVQMCYAGKAATSYYLKVCGDNPNIIGKGSFRVREIRDCHEDLESTYIVRVFAEFESQLRDCWKNHFNKPKSPPMKVLVDNLAGRCSMPVDVMNNVHVVREYRNRLVHGGSAIPVTLAESQGYLCTYLADLPRGWVWKRR